MPLSAGLHATFHYTGCLLDLAPLKTIPQAQATQTKSGLPLKLCLHAKANCRSTRSVQTDAPTSVGTSMDATPAALVLFTEPAAIKQTMARNRVVMRTSMVLEPSRPSLKSPA